MRIMECPECGADIYSDAERCPICGMYVTLGRASTPNWIRWTALGMVFLILSVYVVRCF